MNPRWRLRFNLQEIDLPNGTTMLGRAPECPITLEDPLVSRHHAELQVGDAGCVLVDLGSRNGIHVNGVRRSERVALRPNDRIRLGRDELVLLLANDFGIMSSRPTASSRSCRACGHEFVTELDSCPECGRSTSSN